MKRPISLAFSLLLALAVPASPQEVPRRDNESLLESANLRVHAHHSDGFSPTDEQFRELEIVRREPLFEDLPFLKLRFGDQIVRGQTFHRLFGKGKTKEIWIWGPPQFFLKRTGKVQPFSVYDSEGRLRLTPQGIPFLDWAPTRANADAIFAFCQPKPTVSAAQLARLDTELQGEFAEYLGEGLTPLLKEKAKVVPGFLREVPGDDAVKFVYGGFGYDENTRGIFQFRLTLEANGWQEERAPLISAPPRPRFPIGTQQSQGSSRVAKNPPNYPQLDPVSRQRLEAQRARSRGFEAIVRRVLGLEPNLH